MSAQALKKKIEDMEEKVEFWHGERYRTRGKERQEAEEAYADAKRELRELEEDLEKELRINPALDLKAILKELKRQGFKVTLTKSNHYQVKPPDLDAPLIVTSSSTSDYRSLKNFLARLRKAGFVYPKGGKRKSTRRPRENPGPSTREVNHGRATWRMWHKKENPKKEYGRTEKLLSEKQFVPIGKAHEILYSSDKWERDGDHHDYIHEFESHPKVYIPLSKATEDEIIGQPKTTAAVLGLRSPKKSLVVVELAKVRSFSYFDSEGELVEITGISGAIAASSPDKKTLLILSKKGPILVRGGQMKITARGIVK